MKVFINPDYSRAPKNADNGGIRRVVEAKMKYLPEFGVEIVHQPAQADVIMNHGGALVDIPGIPNIHVGHGLMWSRQPWGEGYQEVNNEVVESMRHAVAHTVPSKWVGDAVRRGGYWYPQVIYHGVEPSEFSPGAESGENSYVLWNKARADYVSDPFDMLKVATMLLGRKFLTTIGNKTDNVTVIGVKPYTEMQKIVSNAGVYLATARETFGIGTLEAMASGVPVAGWNWGGQAEIIKQGVTGYLAPPGNYEALAECIEACYRDYWQLRKNCIADVSENWTWLPRIEQYYQLISDVHNFYNLTERKKVGVVVTTCNLDMYLPQCLESVQQQTFTEYECLVVDDAPVKSKFTKKIVDSLNDPRFIYLPTPENLGLPGSRNFGTSNTNALYIRHLDADDWLAPNALELEAAALDNDRNADIVYGHLEVVEEDGKRHAERSGWPPDQYDWYGQMAHLNQLPSCCMMRREVLARSGGYRHRMSRNEDAEFWCRVTSLGFRAKKITQAVTYFHRMRDSSKGALEWQEHGAEPDWTAWFPWRIGATNYREAATALKRTGGEHPAAHLVPFGAQGRPPAGRKAWYVHDYAYPVVSIIVTCGPGHKPVLIDALDSIQAQTFPDWECVVVNDTGEHWKAGLPGVPWARVLETGGKKGASFARNLGYKEGNLRGKYIVWLDADDYWLPWFLERMVNYAENNNGVIYSEVVLQKEEKKFEIYRYDDFVCDRLLSGMLYPGSSVMYPKKILEAVFEAGGWDTEIPGMEDWDFQMQVHALGFCAYKIPDPLFVYRMYTSTKRETDYAKIDAIRSYMHSKWSAYYKGEKRMSCGCSGKRVPATKTPTSYMSSSGNFGKSIAELTASDAQVAMVALEYLGPMESTFSIRSVTSRDIIYRFGNNPAHKVRSVLAQDAEYMIGKFRDGEKPLYRVVSGGRAEEVPDPESFLSHSVTA